MIFYCIDDRPALFLLICSDDSAISESLAGLYSGPVFLLLRHHAGHSHNVVFTVYEFIKLFFYLLAIQP